MTKLRYTLCAAVLAVNAAFAQEQKKEEPWTMPESIFSDKRYPVKDLPKLGQPGEGFWDGPKNWETADKALFAGAITAQLLDWGQTRDIARNPHKFRETNVFLSSHPTVSEVDRLFTVVMTGTVVTAFVLPQGPRRWFLGSVLLIEAVAVIHNKRAGVKVDF